MTERTDRAGREPESCSGMQDNELIPMILGFAEKKTFNAGEAILDPETGSARFYYVISGSVEVNYIHEAGTRITVALIGEEEFFGEIGYFDGVSRVRDIRAADAVRIAVFTSQVMQNIQQHDPVLYSDFLEYLITRICARFRRIIKESEPVASYAASLSSGSGLHYSDAMLLPQELITSAEWRKVTAAVEGIKTELFDLAHRLQQHDAAGIAAEDTEVRCFQVLKKFAVLLPELHKLMEGTEYEKHLWGYIFKEIYPYFMRSRLAERSYFKPKGYAGDFLMMEHIYKNIPAGEGRLGELIDAFCLAGHGPRAIRGRRVLLRNQLAALTGPLAESGQDINIMNLACGSGRELFDFLRDCTYSQAISILCVDIDPDALQHISSQAETFPHRASIRLMQENIIEWALGHTQQEFPRQDIIYSVGLCDYLDKSLARALIRQCCNHLNSGGVLILGNFTWYPESLFMSNFIKWELIYRTRDEMAALFDDMDFVSVEILSEENNINLFAVARKE
ncbi:MAG: cyclic nucleotide-binding domain-containing protein [Candidatus Electrothrix sp. YB6]